MSSKQRERELGTNNNNNNNRKEKDVIIIIMIMMRGTVCLSVTASLFAAAPQPPVEGCPKGRLSVTTEKKIRGN